jgi:hypothetical protein
MLYVLKYRYVFTRLYIMQSEAVAGQSETISAPILGGAGGRLRWEGAAGDRSMRWQSSGRCGRSTWHGARFFGDPHNLQDEFIEMRTHQCVFMSSIVRA